MTQKHLTILHSFTNIDDIQYYLNQSIDFFGSSKTKGLILELYLTELMNKKGINAVYTGGKNDNGIDIQVFENGSTTPNRFIQVKNHNQKISIDDINSELSKSHKFRSGELEIFSLNGYTKEAVADKSGMIILYSMPYIEELLSMDDRTLLEGPCPVNRLYKHNKETYHNILNILNSDDKVCVIQPTGTGKMYLMEALSIKYINAGNKILVVAPTQEILDQMKNISPLITYSKLIYYSTYAGLHKIKHEDFGLILLDEFHRIEAKEWRSKVDVIVNLNFESKIVGFSATPIREDGKDVRDFFDNNIARNMTLFEAIYEGLLKAPTFITSLYSLTEDVNKLKDEILTNKNISEEEKELKINELNQISIDWNQSSGVVDIIKKYINKDIKKGIVFYKNQEHMEQFYAIVQKWFFDSRIFNLNIRSFPITSHYSDAQNSLNLKEFKADHSGLHLLHSIDKFNEGLHIDDLKLAVFLRATKSKIVFFQQLGRVLSASSDHSSIVLDLVSNIDNIDSYGFQNALDESIEQINIRRKENGILPNGNEVYKVHIIDLTINITEKLSILKESISTFGTKIEQLKLFFQENLRLPTSHHGQKNKNEMILFSFLNYNRELFLLNKLSEDKIIAFKKISETIFDKKEINNEELFLSSIELLKQFIIENKKNPKFNSKNEEERKLAVFLNNNKSFFKDGLLSKERIQIFKEIDENILEILKPREMFIKRILLLRKAFRENKFLSDIEKKHVQQLKRKYIESSSEEDKKIMIYHLYYLGEQTVFGKRKITFFKEFIKEKDNNVKSGKRSIKIDNVFYKNVLKSKCKYELFIINNFLFNNYIDTETFYKNIFESLKSGNFDKSVNVLMNIKRSYIKNTLSELELEMYHKYDIKYLGSFYKNCLDLVTYIEKEGIIPLTTRINGSKRSFSENITRFILKDSNNTDDNNFILNKFLGPISYFLKDNTKMIRRSYSNNELYSIAFKHIKGNLLIENISILNFLKELMDSIYFVSNSDSILNKFILDTYSIGGVYKKDIELFLEKYLDGTIIVNEISKEEMNAFEIIKIILKDKIDSIYIRSSAADYSFVAIDNLQTKKICKFYFNFYEKKIGILKGKDETIYDILSINDIYSLSDKIKESADFYLNQ